MCSRFRLQRSMNIFRAKNIKNKPRINEDPKDAMLREFQEEIARLKSQISTRQAKSGKRRKSAKRLSTDSNKLMTNSDMSNSSVPMDTSTEMDSSMIGETTSNGEVININKAADDMEARLAVERELLEADTGMLANEKEKLLSDLSIKEAALKAQRQEREQVVARIKALESKLLCGTGVGGMSSAGVGSGSSNNMWLQHPYHHSTSRIRRRRQHPILD